MPRRAKNKGGCSLLTVVLIIVPFVALLACGSLYSLVSSVVEPGPSPTPTPESGLRMAYSPEKGVLFTELVGDFNAQNLKAPDGEPLKISAVQMASEDMSDAALRGDLKAISPDSSIWLDQIDRAWMAQNQSDSSVVGETVRYAISPVVIATWENVARSMGYPDKRIGWEDIIAKARSDPKFGWSHPSTGSASGLLATLAMFYAGAGKTRGLTIEDAKADATLQYVGAVEKTVRHYGEGEWPVIQRLIQDGRQDLDAFVVQEQLVIYYNSQASGEKLVAIYPREGTLWEDHPLALLESGSLSADDRLTFQKFRDYLASKPAQERVLSHGFRPTDLTISLNDPQSPVSAKNGVNPAEPQTALQIPGPAVVEVVRNVWWYTKRHTNVYLVVDTSGSMQGEKLDAAREALNVFLDQIKGDQESVGIVEFSSSVNNIIPLAELSGSRQALQSNINDLSAGGDTALLDAIKAAYDRLQKLGDRERINAIVAMTDGRENNSSISLDRLLSVIKSGNSRGVPVVVFCIAFGDDADMGVLQSIAQASNGQARKGDLNTIRGLYKILSTYF